MTPDMVGPDPWLRKVLEEVPRHEDPPVPLEAIMERWKTRRRRVAALVGSSVAAVALVLVALRSPPPEAPVHLQIRVVDEVLAPDEAAPSSLDAGPEEVRAP